MESRVSVWGQYGLVVLLIFLSGNVFFISFFYEPAVISVAILCGVALLARWIAQQRPHFGRGSALQLTAYAALITGTLLFNPAANPGSHAAVFLQLFIAAAAAEFMKPRQFMLRASLAITGLAAIALLFFFAGLAFPAFISLFPVTQGSASVDYYNAGVYVYLVPKGYDSIVPFTRNNGIFWEPGAYQAFLNMALLWLFSDENVREISPVRRTWAFVILTASVLTTFSATGYVALALVVLYRRRAVARLMSNWAWGVLAAAFVGWMASQASVDLEFSFTKYFGDASSVLRRLSLDRLGEFGSSAKDALLGAGLDSGPGNRGDIWNSVVHTALSLGIPFTLILLWNYMRGGFAMIHRGGLMQSALLLLIFSTESLIWRPFFAYIAFAHFDSAVKRQRACYGQHSPRIDTPIH